MLRKFWQEKTFEIFLLSLFRNLRVYKKHNFVTLGSLTHDVSSN